MPLPREFKIPDFIVFSDEDEKSSMEHISQFTAQCGKANQNKYYKLQLFHLFLTAVVLIKHSSLPPNSVQNWADMEWLFHDCFYRPELEVTVADLMSLKQ